MKQQKTGEESLRKSKAEVLKFSLLMCHARKVAPEGGGTSQQPAAAQIIVIVIALPVQQVH
jgi:hypothetical protein